MCGRGTAGGRGGGDADEARPERQGKALEVVTPRRWCKIRANSLLLFDTGADGDLKTGVGGGHGLLWSRVAMMGKVCAGLGTQDD